MDSYEVVIEGTVMPGFDPTQTQADLARLTGQTGERAAALLSGTARPVKRAVDAETAERYVAALRKIGVAAYRRQPAATLQLDIGAEVPTAGTTAVGADIVAATQTSPADEPALSSCPSPSTVQPQAEAARQAEVILFEGDVTWIKSAINVKLGYGLVSNRHFLFQVNGDAVFDVQKSELVSVQEKKHGFSDALALTLTDQRVVTVQAANHAGLLRALRILAGLEQAPAPRAAINAADATQWYYENDGKRLGPITGAQIKSHCQSNHTIFRHTVVWHEGMTEWMRADKTELATYFDGPPPLSGDSVKNGTAWLAAFGPLIATLLAGAIGGIFYGNPDYWSTKRILYLLVVAIAMMILLAKVDQLALQKAGHNTTSLGLGNPAWVPAYLFRRAKVFGHSRAYAIVWCVLFGVEVLFEFAL